ncbi:ComEA family DNA-binding protein [Dyella silvatica]|uniref:ComEA family DNA-binding protein n=1 Tax=Dyella silvatica TaxID=2992128 RepID=UPI00225BCC3F|nr:helix-hairpin-helix domain-containing protein [Dyella silvatica]
MFRKLAAWAFALALALPAFAATPVNVNKANAETIAQSLDGIGPSKAKAIVAWRDEHGPFKSVDDLIQVKGIGEATLERIRSSVLLSDEVAAETASPAKSKTKQAAGE